MTLDGFPDLRDDGYHIAGHADREPRICPHEGCGGALWKWDFSHHVIRDLPLFKRPVLLELRQQRYRCKRCHRSDIWQPLRIMEGTRRMTGRLLDYIRHAAILNTFTSVAAEVGVDEGTIRDIFTVYSAGALAERA